MVCLYTVTETAQILKVNRNAVYELVRSEYLKTIKYGAIKIPSTEIEGFISKWAGYDLSDLKNPKQINTYTEKGDS
jgi:hypothetical protein